ncbi:MAG: precorrin-6y C5,15-methyltransferase (decarboxylating) subunit CbiE [Rhizobiaceae bacterium]
MSAWLTIIGIGDDGLDGLPEASRLIVRHAQTIIAPDRVIKASDYPGAEVRLWSEGFQPILDLISERRDTPVVILATGDPMHFGVGSTLTRHFGVGEMLIIPAVSAFSLAAARLGWALQDVDCITLHGRPVAKLAVSLAPGRRILAYTSNAATVREAAQLLDSRGYGASRITVLEHMGGTSERIVELTVSEAKTHKGSDFNTLAIACVGDSAGRILPVIPGLPDDAFEHDGQLTKREVRAASLAALAPYPGAVLWDVGAGCGSIAIEWMRAARGSTAFAIEDNVVRRAMMARNAEKLGVPEMKIIEGRAPAALAGLPVPDAVFIGGGVSEAGVFEGCFESLKPGGRLVANAVTVEGEARLIALAQAHGGKLSRIAVSRAEPVGRFLAFKPLMPVTMLEISKDRS